MSAPDLCEHIDPADDTTFRVLATDSAGHIAEVTCDVCGRIFATGIGPEDDPDSDDEGEGESDEPAAHVSGDPAALGERIRATVERESVADDAPDDEPPAMVPESPPLDPFATTCPTCDGFGETITGSRRESELTRVCVSCSGKGWVERATVPSIMQQIGAPALATTTTAPPEQWSWQEPHPFSAAS